MNFQVKPSSVGQSDDRLMMKYASQHEIVSAGISFDPPYTQLTVHYEPEHKTIWVRMHPEPRPCFNLMLLDELTQVQKDVVRAIDAGEEIRYFVLASDIEGIFSYGGDLDLFRRLIEAKDRAGLMSYATACIELLFANIRGLNRNLTMISLVQGDALGGGLEAALSTDVLIAERGAQLGFPEVLFNLFPGMGAYSFLSRKLGGGLAKRLIESGKIYSAEEQHEMGLVDVRANEGQGEAAVYNYIKMESRRFNGIHASRKALACCNPCQPISYEELMAIAKIWIDAALQLGRRDLRLMERLVRRQSEKLRNAA